MSTHGYSGKLPLPGNASYASEPAAANMAPTSSKPIPFSSTSKPGKA